MMILVWARESQFKQFSIDENSLMKSTKTVETISISEVIDIWIFLESDCH